MSFGDLEQGLILGETDKIELLRKDIFPRPITTAEFLRHSDYLGQLLRENNYPIVIIEPHPRKGNCGAGHSREAWALEEFLSNLGLGENITRISLENIGGRLGKLYPLAHRSPRLYRFFDGIVGKISSNRAEIMDKDLIRRMDYSAEIRQSLSRRGLRNAIFLTTHVAGAISVFHLLSREGFDGFLIEFLVDPWPPHGLRMMSLPLFLGEKIHWIVVHDLLTKELYRRVRPNVNPSCILPLGTPSPTGFRKGEIRERATNDPFHIGIEFSGNRVPPFEEKVLGIIPTMAEDIRSGQLRLTIHVMWHKKTKEMIEKVLESLGLMGNPNIRIIYHSTKEEDYAHHAIVSRNEYITGRFNNQEWPPPDAVFTKGGEVPLEDRGRMLVAVLFGEGHEARDTQFGVIAGRAIDLREIDPLQVYEVVKKELRRREITPLPQPPPSLAPFALLAPFDFDYLEREILRKYFPHLYSLEGIKT